MLAAAVLSAFLAVPARAQLDAWDKLAGEDLHTKTFSTYAGFPKEIFASCDGGRLSLPKAYLLDYQLTRRDQAALQRSLDAGRRLADIRQALKDGYLPVDNGFRQSEGLWMIQPGLFRDGTYDLDRPDVLSYVKRADEDDAYRLAGMIYVAGARRPVLPGVDFADASRRPEPAGIAKTSTWDHDDQVCMIVHDDSVSLYQGGEAPHHCRDGTLFVRMYRLYVWSLVYDPLGLFADRNTIVDWMDKTQDFGPLCPKPRKKRGNKS